MKCLHKHTWNATKMGRNSVKKISEDHYGDVIMGTMVSQITSLTIVYSTVYSGADQRKHQSSASLAFLYWIHRGPVNSPHKWPLTRNMFPFDDVIMLNDQLDTSPGVFMTLGPTENPTRCLYDSLPTSLVCFCPWTFVLKNGYDQLPGIAH